MKLTPWLRSLKSGITRVFKKQAKVKRREEMVGSWTVDVGSVCEFLEDRALLAISLYSTPVQDGTYARGVLVQGPSQTIPLPNDPGGQPSIFIRVDFTPNIDIDITNGRPTLAFNTFSLNPNAPNYTGLFSTGSYLDGNQTNVDHLDFYYRIQEGENTPGPTQVNPVLRVVNGTPTGSANNGAIIVNTGTSVPVSMATLPAAGRSANGQIVDFFSLLNKNIYIDTRPVIIDVNAGIIDGANPPNYTAGSTSVDSLPFGQADANFPGGSRRPYRVGDPPIYFNVDFTEPVFVTGTPLLYLNTDQTAGLLPADARAQYVSGSGTNRLLFTYTVRPGDNSNDLDIVLDGSGNVINLNGGALVDQDFFQNPSFLQTAGPNGVIPGTLGRNRAIQVDTTPPFVPTTSGVTAKDPSGTYGAGTVLTLRVSFNEPIVLAGTPSLILNTGGVNREATYLSFEGTDTLLFTYVVQPGDSSAGGAGGFLDYVSTDSLRLNGGQITDLAGNIATPSPLNPGSVLLPQPGAAGSLSQNRKIVIDTAVQVINVTTTLPDGSYGLGQVIPIQIEFNKPVTVTGVPQLLINLDGAPNNFPVNYSTGSGTNFLTFNYTIQNGHNAADLDYSSANALQLNGGSIINIGTNAVADIRLAIPGADTSLGKNKNIAIDTVAPNAVGVNAAATIANGTYTTNQVIPITVDFSEPVSVTGVPQVTLDTNGIPGPQPVLLPGEFPDAIINYTSGSGTTRLTFNYTIRDGENSLDLDALNMLLGTGVKITDLAQNLLPSNAGVVPLPTSAAGGIMTVATTTPNITAVAQVSSFTVGDNPIAGDTYSFTVIGAGTSSVTPGATTTSNVAANLRTFFPTGAAVPVTATSLGSQVIVTGKVAGVPFTIAPAYTLLRVGGTPVAGDSYTFTVVGAGSITVPFAAGDTTTSIATKLTNMVNSQSAAYPVVAITPPNGTDVVLRAKAGVLTSFTVTGVAVTNAGVPGGTLALRSASSLNNVNSMAMNVTGTPAVGDTYTLTVVGAAPVISVAFAAGDDTTAIAQKLVTAIQGQSAAFPVTASFPGGVPGPTFLISSKVTGSTFALSNISGAASGQALSASPASIVTTSVAAPATPGGSATLPVTTTAAVAAQKKISTITVNLAGTGTSYNVLINGIALNYTATVADTTTTIATKIANLINANLTLSAQVSAVAAGNVVTVTAVTAGVNHTILLLQSLAANRNLVIDTAPIITNVTVALPPAVGGLADGVYTAGNVDLQVTFSEPVTETTIVVPGDPSQGVPFIALETNGTPGFQATATPASGGNPAIPADARAIYFSGTGTKTLVFRYAIAATGESSGDLDLAFTNAQLTTAVLQSNGGFLRDASAKDFNPKLPLPGAPGSLGANRDIQIDDPSVNNAPVNMVPGTQTTTEDVLGGLIFSAATNNAIQIRDVDVGASNIQVTFTAAHGTITLPTVTGLGVVGNGTAVVVVTGPLALLNTRLSASGLIFAPDKDVNSSSVPLADPIQLKVTTSDLGNTGPAPVNVKTDEDIIIITVTPVNDIPVATAQDRTTGAGTPITIILTAIDPDVADVRTYVIDPTLPPVSAGSQTVKTPFGTLSPIIGGDTVVYTPDAGYIGDDFFTFVAKDGVSTSVAPARITISMVPAVSLGLVLPDTPGFPDVIVPEGNSGTTSVKFTVTLNAIPKQAASIDFVTVAGNAVPGKDYTTTTGKVNFAIGQKTADIFIPIIGNLIDEPNKTFSIKLFNPVKVVLGNSQSELSALITIQNDDGVSVGDVSVKEGDTGTTQLDFVVSLSQPQTSTVTVDYKTGDGTASKTSDYDSKTGSVTFAPGELTKTVSIIVNGDTLSEANETVFVDLSNSRGGPTLGKSRGVGTILDDDALPLYSIADAKVSEGNLGVKKLTFTASLSAPSGQVVTVKYATSDLTAGSSSATAGTDYIAKTGTVTFQPGQLTQTFDILVNGDTTIESNEDFSVDLSAGVNANPGTKVKATGTIINDDGVAVADVTVLEGNSPIITNKLTFNVTIPQSSQSIVVHYDLTDGTAIFGQDYQAPTTGLSGNLTFTPGTTSLPVIVPIIGDFAPEPDETLFLNLTYPAGSSPNLPPIATPIVTGTIKNDDNVPTITVTSSSVKLIEGDSGTKNIAFTLNLVDSSNRPTTVGTDVNIDYATYDGTALAGIDYNAVSATAKIAAGTSTTTIFIPVRGDVSDEDDETFSIHLDQPSLGVYNGNDLLATIVDNDPAPKLSVSSPTLLEGQAGKSIANVIVSLSAPSGKTVTANYETVDGTALNGQDPNGSGSGNDYEATGGSLIFLPGETSKTISVVINGDTLNENNETFSVKLTFLSNATGVSGTGAVTSTPTGVVTIKNDDGTPTVEIKDVSVLEGNTGTKTPAEFKVNLLSPSTLPVTVSYSVAGGSATIADNDFEAPTGSSLTFAPGETEKIITVNVIGDLKEEGDETFTVTLKSPQGAILGRSTAVGTIRTDDVPATLSINDVKQAEGNSGTSQMIFTVTRSGSTTETSTVQYTTNNQTATGSQDYVATTDKLTFLPGETSKSISVTINGDSTPEADETFFISLANPTNASISDPQGIGTILNDDNSPPSVTVPQGTLNAKEETNLAIAGISVSDADAGTASINVRLSAAQGIITVREDVTGGLTGRISGNGTGNVILEGPISLINITLSGSNGVVYRGGTDFFGADKLTVIANDLGNSGGTGNALEDTKFVNINVVNVNDAPVIDFTGNTPPNSVNGVAVTPFASPNVLTLTDTDNTSFNLGKLTVAFVGQPVGLKDKISVLNEGKAQGQIGLRGSKVYYGGEVIGTVKGGTKGSPLVITLNAKASVEATQALMRNITFSTAKSSRTKPISTKPRTLRMTVTDGNTGTSNPVDATVTVSAN